MPILKSTPTAIAESFAQTDRVATTASRPPIVEPSATALPLVLVIDDHEDSRIIARLVLEAAGFRVCEAASGVEGLSLAVSLQPAVVLLDLILPGIDGWGVARRLRRDPAADNIGIIALTAVALAEECDRARDAGCDEVLTKPVSPKGIVEMVRRFVGRPKLASTERASHTGSRLRQQHRASPTAV